VTEAFSKDELGVGHALLLAKLQPQQQEQALAACYQTQYGNGDATKRILLPVRYLQQWIEQNVMLVLKEAPFDKKDAELVPTAGSCLDCPKRTGHNKLLFADVRQDACTDPACYAAKLDAHVKATVTAKPKLVQITTAYGKPAEGSLVLPRNQYVEIRQDNPQRKGQSNWPEYRTCRSITEAIIAEGTDKGEIRKICADPNCPIHHPKKQQARTDAAFKAEQERRRREEVIAQTSGIRVLAAIGKAVPVRLMKRDLLFVAERLTLMLDERKLAILIREHGIGKVKNGETPAKAISAFVRKTDESTLGRLLIETTILLFARSPQEVALSLRTAADYYKVNVDAIATAVKKEFAAKEKARTEKKAVSKSPANAQNGKKSAAA